MLLSFFDHHRKEDVCIYLLANGLQPEEIGKVRNVVRRFDARLHLSRDEHRYFNAGVLLINLKTWRESRFVKRARELLGKGDFQLCYADQVNPERRSSGSQFYIVWGKKYTEYELKQIASQLDGQRGQQIFNDLAAQHRDSIQAMYQRGDQKGLMALQNRLSTETEKILQSTPGFAFTPEQTKDYTTIGGTPFLDNQYTVFGEVVEGLEVVEKIQGVTTGSADRPKEDVVMTVTVME